MIELPGTLRNEDLFVRRCRRLKVEPLDMSLDQIGQEQVGKGR